MVAETSFPKFWFSLESSNFIFGDKHCQLFSLKRQIHSIHFLRKCLPGTQVWITIVRLSVVLSNTNEVAGKEACCAHPQTIAQVPFLQTTTHFLTQHKRWVCSSRSITQIRKSAELKGADVIKWTSFTALSKLFFSETGFFFKNIFIDYAITVIPFPPPLHSILPTSSLPHSLPIVDVHGSYL